MKRTSIVVFLLVVLACLAGWLGNMAIGQNDPVGQSALTPQGTPTPAPITLPPPGSAPSGRTANGKAQMPNFSDGPGLSFGSGEPRPTQPSSPIIPAQFAAQPPQPPNVPLGATENVFAEPGPGQSNDNPTGRQEPAVSLEWIGPPTAKLGQPVTYQIILKNISSSP